MHFVSLEASQKACGLRKNISRGSRRAQSLGNNGTTTRHAAQETATVQKIAHSAFSREKKPNIRQIQMRKDSSSRGADHRR